MQASAPLNAVDLEGALLGAILHNGDVFDLIDGELVAGDFSEALHARLFESFVTARHAGRQIDVRLAVAALGENARTQITPELTAGQYVARLAAEATGTLLARDYARAIREMADKRHLDTIAEMIKTGAASSMPSGLSERDAGENPGPIPPRGWLLGNQFCRKFLSSIVAAGGTGKTALRMLQYISLATGRPLTGQHVFRRSRVLLLSFEDDDQELDRRIAAALKHHRVERSEIKEWLYIAAPKGVKLAEMQNGSRHIGQLEKLLREAIQRRRPDVIGLDPFVKIHSLEENDNGAMDFVCDLLTKLAIEFDVAIDSPHHTKKGQLAAGDADNGRGGGSIRDAARLVYTLSAMAEDEAKAFGIPEGQRRGYVRLDSAKVNLVPPAYKASWFRLVSVRLENGTPQYPNGDEVQTVEPWSPPETWDVPVTALNAALTEIEAGMSNGQRYSDASAARERAAWIVVQRHCADRTEPQCREIVRTWVKNGVLYPEPYHDPIKREERSGLRLDPSKRPT
jgi:AAA domain/DnaB-like helicase N terminal domain